MNLVDWINANIPLDLDPLVIAIALGIIFVVIHDFYNLLFGAIFSWFKRK